MKYNITYVYMVCRKLGVLDASKLFVEVQLSGYRGLFEEVQALSEGAFPAMIEAMPSLKRAYKLFLSAQGKTVRICCSKIYKCFCM